MEHNKTIYNNTIKLFHFYLNFLSLKKYGNKRN